MESSVLTTKGQIVIPKGLRDKYKLSPGTKVFFEETAEGIILKHIDAAFIKKAKGIIPVKKGEKPMAEWWPEYKAAERNLEEKKLNLLGEPGAHPIAIGYKKAVKIKRKK